jgi:methyl-accepting chemotaxis protein
MALAITIILFLISTGITTHHLLTDTRENVYALVRRGDRAIDITQMGSLFRTKDIRIADYIQFEDERLIEEFQEKSKEFSELEQKISSGIYEGKQKELYDKIKNNNKKVNTIFLDNIIPAVKAGDMVKAEMERKKAADVRGETVQVLNELKKEVDNKRRQAIDEAEKSVEEVIIVLGISVISSIVLGIIIIVLISKQINIRLKQIVDINNKVAEGDLTVEKLKYSGKDEIGQLSNAINNMIENLKNIIQQTSNASKEINISSNELTGVVEEVKHGSKEMVETMQKMSAGAEEEAASSSEIANIVNEFNELVIQSNESGQVLNDLSNMVLSNADEGNAQMQASVNQMRHIYDIVKNSVQKVRELEESSSEISKLVKVINDISEQTNLLALNAAIEAARAGESGKGFAVVAEEIRKLAEQVGNSVGEITVIVEGIQKESNLVSKSLEEGYLQVEEGTHQIKFTGEAFGKINNEVTNMAEKIQHVTNNLYKITRNSEKINAGIEQIAAISQENAAGIEETSASIQQQDSSMESITSKINSLNMLSEDLNKVIDKFEV